MVYRLREEYDDVQLARMEDPLPDGPWDLVISVLSVHHLQDDAKQTLFRRVREQSRALVIGDVVKAEAQVTPIEAGFDFPDTAEQLAEWSAARSPGPPTTWRSSEPSTERTQRCTTTQSGRGRHPRPTRASSSTRSATGSPT